MSHDETPPSHDAAPEGRVPETDETPPSHDAAPEGRVVAVEAPATHDAAPKTAPLVGRIPDAAPLVGRIPDAAPEGRVPETAPLGRIPETAHELREVAVKAMRDPRTVRKAYLGLATDLARECVAAAATCLGYAPPPKAVKGGSK